MRKLVAWWMGLRGYEPHRCITVRPDGPKTAGCVVWDIFGRQWYKEWEIK